MLEAKINIKDFIEFQTTHKERIELVNFILHELTTNSEYIKWLREELKSLLEVEMEYQKDAKLISAYKTILETKLNRV
jgi:predicted ribosome quality control (RQC) complex YloA/Tae2 family protein